MTTSPPRITLEQIAPSPFSDYINRQGKVWAIIFHTRSGREIFGQYDTKAEGVADAREYDLQLAR